MSIQANHDRVIGRIWQAVAQSGVDVSPIPHDQMDKLVAKVADGVLREFDAMLDEIGAQSVASPSRAAGVAAPAAGAAAADEQILWEGRPFLSLVERYVVTDQRVRIITGLVGRANEDIELIRVKDVDHTQGISERMLGIGDVQLRSVDASRPNVVLRNVKDPQAVHEIVRRAMLDARKKYPYIFAQEL
jgi:hypothetical protein